jgi:hypothetical protein
MKTKAIEQQKKSKPAVQLKDVNPKKDARAGAKKISSSVGASAKIQP